MRRLLLIALAMIPFSVTSAEWTVGQCVDYALKHNVSIQNKERDIQMLDSEITAAWGAFLPKVTANAGYILYEKPAQSTTFNISMDNFNMTMSMPGATAPDYTASIAASQPLFMGGALFYNLKSQYKRREAIDEEYRKLKMDTTYNVSQTYYNVIYTHQMLKVIEESLEIVKKQVAMAEARYKNGESTQVDLLQARVELSNLYPQHIKLKSLDHVALLRLKNSIGMSEQEELIIAQDFSVEDYVLPATVEPLIETALKKRPDLLILQANEQSLVYAHRISKGQYLPKLMMNGSYSVSKENWDDAWNDNYSISLFLSWNLFDGFSRESSVKKTGLTLDSLRATRMDIEQKIRMDVRMKYETIVETRERFKAEEEALSLSQQTLVLAESSYKEGLISLLDLMRARLGYNDSRTGYIQAKYDMNLAVLELKNVTGTLFGEE